MSANRAARRRAQREASRNGTTLLDPPQPGTAQHATDYLEHVEAGAGADADGLLQLIALARAPMTDAHRRRQALGWVDAQKRGFPEWMTRRLDVDQAIAIGKQAAREYERGASYGDTQHLVNVLLLAAGLGATTWVEARWDGLHPDQAWHMTAADGDEEPIEVGDIVVVYVVDKASSVVTVAAAGDGSCDIRLTLLPDEAALTDVRCYAAKVRAGEATP